MIFNIRGRLFCIYLSSKADIAPRYEPEFYNASKLIFLSDLNVRKDISFLISTLCVLLQLFFKKIFRQQFNLLRARRCKNFGKKASPYSVFNSNCNDKNWLHSALLLLFGQDLSSQFLLLRSNTLKTTSTEQW